MCASMTDDRSEPTRAGSSAPVPRSLTARPNAALDVEVNTDAPRHNPSRSPAEQIQAFAERLASSGSSRSRLLHVSLNSQRLKVVNLPGLDVDNAAQRLENGLKVGFHPVQDPHHLQSGLNVVPELPTDLDEESLAKKLFALRRDQNSTIAERGFNPLYLALGFLEYYESEYSDKRFTAPLVLVPVTLERRDVSGRSHKAYRLTLREEEPAKNVPLATRLRDDHGVHLPERDDASERPSDYLWKTEDVIDGRPRWKVHGEHGLLGFFDFAKRQMYDDLLVGGKSLSRQHFNNHALVQGLLGSGFEPPEPMIPDNTSLDEAIDPVRSIHVVEADSSQARVIEDARQGQSLVVQGPPGTGKSQTIVNVIANLVSEGKRVLFVAEKMAALDVVFKRLDECGLSGLCLELHSHKAAKLPVYKELASTIRRRASHAPHYFEPSQTETYRTTRDYLTQRSRDLHATLEGTELTAHNIIGRISKLVGEGISAPSYEVEPAATWSQRDEAAAREEVREFLEALRVVGEPGKHPLRRMTNDQLLAPFEKTVAEPATKVLKCLDRHERRLKKLRKHLRRTTKHAGRVGQSPLVLGPPLIELEASLDRFAVLVDQMEETLAASGFKLAPTQPVSERQRILSALLHPPASVIADYAKALNMLVNARPAFDLAQISTRLGGRRYWVSKRKDKAEFLRCLWEGSESSAHRLQREEIGEIARFVLHTAQVVEDGQLEQEALLELADALPGDESLSKPLANASSDHLEQLTSWSAQTRAATTPVEQEPNMTPVMRGSKLLLDANGAERLSELDAAVDRCRNAYLRVVDMIAPDTTRRARAERDGALIDTLLSEAGIEKLRKALAQVRQRLDACDAEMSSTLAALRSNAGTSRHNLIDNLHRLAESEQCCEGAHVELARALMAPLLPAADAGTLPNDWRVALQQTLPDAARVRAKALHDKAERSRARLDASVSAAIDELGIEGITLPLCQKPTSLKRVRKLMTALVEHAGDYQDWRRYLTASHRVHERGIGDLFEGDIDTSVDEQLRQFDFAMALARQRLLASDHVALAERTLGTAANKAAKFKSHDLTLLKLTRDVAVSRYQLKSPEIDQKARKFIEHEARKVKRHKPLKSMLTAHSNAFLTLKPCLLMSPMSVAQYLPITEFSFDAVIFDEASQVKPEDALGSLLRVKPGGQAIVVGDQKQLPPTNFFERLHQDEGEEEGHEDEGEVDVKEHESVLSLCDAQGFGSRKLLWHYRSKHPSLIETSNREFYDHELILPPSPAEDRADLGLSFSYIEGGIYYPSSSGPDASTNPMEARAVVEAARAHAHECPELSLGIATFSKPQADLIAYQLDQARGVDSILDEFMRTEGLNDLFVKNLENVQGDERDVVFISVGYGPRPSDGKVEQRFGPVNMSGGWRRLNVLFTRARLRCVVHCSFDPAGLEPTKAMRDGVRILKEFLLFAKTGVSPAAELSRRAYESPLEEDVANVIDGLGYSVESQVGTAGYRIDLAVRHPQRPQEFMLAVETDGATYHRSMYARERDWLRQQVLEQHGWHFHRVWSTDWFHERERAIAQLRAALNEAERRSVSGVRARLTATGG